MSFPHPLLDDASELASFQGWTEEVYVDFLRLQRGELTEAEFND